MHTFSRRTLMRAALATMPATSIGSPHDGLSLAVDKSSRSAFQVFDGTGLVDMPSALYDSYAVERIPVIYEWEFVSQNQTRGDFAIHGPDLRHVERLAQRHRNTPRLVINVESWRIWGSWARADRRLSNKLHISRYISLLGAWRNANPNTTIGLYGICSSQSDAIQYTLRNDTSGFLAHEESKRGIGALCDAVYPSGYWRIDSAELYRAVTRLQAQAAREIYGLPVQFFVWHRGAGAQLQYHWLNSPTYRYTLDTVREYGDGAVIWAMSDERSSDRFLAKTPPPHPHYHPPKSGLSTNALLRSVANVQPSTAAAFRAPSEIQWYFSLLGFLAENRLQASTSSWNSPSS
jgi:hypothetical protein